ncbi:MAG: beta-lactamase family protein, partial [Candidatus Aminicenantes bacterium]|nr:beta-lactamase family protein [Candidatus Aminicenantes bacterium]
MIGKAAIWSEKKHSGPGRLVNKRTDQGRISMTHRDRGCPGRKTAPAVLLFLACALSQVGNAVAGDLSERIDKAMSGRYPSHEPGATVLAARDGNVVFRGAYGLASVELQVPMRPEMVFCLASVTKLFTAVAAMQLVEEGALRLDDEVTKYLPELVETRGVTIAHLLS